MVLTEFGHEIWVRPVSIRKAGVDVRRRIIVGHGRNITSDARSAWEAAFAFVK